jgi:hypothetical protein
MATFQTQSAVGIREDLSDVIYNISPTDTPFMSTVGKTKATAVYHEWQKDTLASVNLSNAAVDGADASSATLAATTRVGNRTQISQKTVKVSGTLESVLKAGRKSEKAYQLAKAAAEIKRDMEAILLSNQTANAGNSTSARLLGGLQAWTSTNYSLGTSGVAGSNGTTAKVDGTNRALTEAMLQSVVRQVFVAGGSPTVFLVTPKQKQNVSAFAGIAAQRFAAPADAPTTIIGAADVYMSDFGTLSVVPDRFLANDTDADGGENIFVLDPEYVSVAYLRPFQTNELAIVGDSQNTQLLCEYTLEVKNEAAQGIIGDLS